ncbi:MAG: hypothetical protein HRU48_04770 [Vibrio sp.]|uniref:hypothetical protein n=1 Tax=Vibrio TaxID=662 RepID=UPI001EC3C5D1|nr:hypothetical protein [Vibrio sp.]NRB66675.1 hypothetical protein [Vibrio sp.]
MEEQNPDLKAMLEQVDQEVAAGRVLSSLRLLVVLLYAMLKVIKNSETQLR